VYEHELSWAHGVVDRAAEIGLGLFLGEGLEVRRKADLSLVTQADLAIERMVREQLAVAFPDDRILGEEEGGSSELDGRVWILDPIDATANFARGIPIWAVLLGLVVDGEVVLGVVDAPAMHERYAAVRGAGATCNDRPIRVSGVATIAEAQVLHAQLTDLLRGPYREATLQLIDAAWRERGLGDFWAHLLVARGAADVAFEPSLNIWDWAALKVIVEEAGGRMTTFDGSPVAHRSSVLTTNHVLHDEVVRRLSA
jgi:histidinol-phosphatase